MAFKTNHNLSRFSQIWPSYLRLNVTIFQNVWFQFQIKKISVFRDAEWIESILSLSFYFGHFKSNETIANRFNAIPKKSERENREVALVANSANFDWMVNGLFERYWWVPLMRWNKASSGWATPSIKTVLPERRLRNLRFGIAESGWNDDLELFEDYLEPSKLNSHWLKNLLVSSLSICTWNSRSLRFSIPNGIDHGLCWLRLIVQERWCGGTHEV